MAKYLIATDGGARGNGDGTGASAWAFVVYDEGEFRKGSKSEGYPKHHCYTNNAMESLAILEALRWADRRPPNTDVTIFTDSNYMVQTINQWMWGWARSGWTKKSKGEIQNLDTIKQIHAIIAKGERVILVKHVKGHQVGNSFEATSNREADALCNVKMDEVEFETEVLR